jgi:hypothetical protein
VPEVLGVEQFHDVDIQRRELLLGIAEYRLQRGMVSSWAITWA